MAEGRRTGISFGPRVLRRVEIARKATGAVVSAGEWKLPFPLEAESFFDPSRSEDIRSRLARQGQVATGGPTEVVISLPVGFYQVRLFPLDSDLGETEADAHLLWELQQGLSGEVSIYNYGFHRLTADMGLTDTIVAAAVRKDLAKSVVQTIGTPLGRTIAIEADVFSAVRAFDANYVPDPLRPLLLLGRGEGAFSTVAIAKGKPAGFGIWPIPADPGEGTSGQIAEAMRDILDRFVRARELCGGLEGLAGIYLYGEAVDEEFIDALRDTCETRVQRLNPFLRNRPAAMAGDEVAVESHPEAFATAFGAALW
ncbi:MAG: hypothetical protein ONB23_03495 [candidate division KSB1 bacterium]|nr:hypothetical protein [candidate division KSB1 bacterium]